MSKLDTIATGVNPEDPNNLPKPKFETFSEDEIKSLVEETYAQLFPQGESLDEIKAKLTNLGYSNFQIHGNMGNNKDHVVDTCKLRIREIFNTYNGAVSSFDEVCEILEKLKFRNGNNNFVHIYSTGGNSKIIKESEATDIEILRAKCLDMTLEDYVKAAQTDTYGVKGSVFEDLTFKMPTGLDVVNRKKVVTGFSVIANHTRNIRLPLESTGLDLQRTLHPIFLEKLRSKNTEVENNQTLES